MSPHTRARARARQAAGTVDGTSLGATHGGSVTHGGPGAHRPRQRQIGRLRATYGGAGQRWPYVSSTPLPPDSFQPSDLDMRGYGRRSSSNGARSAPRAG